MPLDSYHHAERPGPDYRPGNPALFTFHGTGGDETRFLDLSAALFPEAVVIAPRGDVSENGMRRFFRRAGEGVYDMEDLAARTRAMADFVTAHIKRLAPSRVIGLGYSNGANILASVILEEPGLFSDAVLMHPLIPWEIENGDDLAAKSILVTAGGRDPICPPDLTGQLIEGLESRGATVKSVWHPGGHEIAQSELDAIATFLTGIRADMTDVKTLPVEREEDDAGKGRYLVRGPGETIAEMTYRLIGKDQIIIDHTEVPDAFRGTGTGMRLLKTLLADAEKAERKIIPLCPYAAAQFEKHPEWADMLAYRVRAKKG
ncbi:N-acetyltransferase [Oricola nitratireducens]|uniref:N-acetyltransferase n=1 Tax=Oricola nitratireducens TaxID=2775868 RepID=UPI00186769C3